MTCRIARTRLEILRQQYVGGIYTAELPERNPELTDGLRQARSAPSPTAKVSSSLAERPA